MTKVIVPPVAVEVDGAKCYIIEASRHNWIDGKTHYIVTVFCECCGIRSRTFPLDVTSNDELIAKLKVEVAKMKLLAISGKQDILR